MDYQEYMKGILTEEELKQLNDCYTKDSISGLRVNLLKSSKETIKKVFSFTKEHPFVNRTFL